MPDHGETSLRSETSSVSCADSFPLGGEARAAYQSFPRASPRRTTDEVLPCLPEQSEAMAVRNAVGRNDPSVIQRA